MNTQRLVHVPRWQWSNRARSPERPASSDPWTGEPQQHSASPQQSLGAQTYSPGVRVCAVLFLDVVQYSKRSASDQPAIKQALNADVRLALHGIPREDMIVLDTGDGVAITFLSDIEQALAVALKLQLHLYAPVP